MAWLAVPAECRLESNMLELIKRILTEQNQFATSGLLLMIVGGLGVVLRAVPQKLWEWCVGQTTMTITVKDDDVAFVWVKEWFLEQKFLNRIRRVDLDTTLRHDQLEFIPAPGFHWFWYSGRPFQVVFHRSEETKRWSEKRTEELTFKTIGRKQSFLRNFVNDIVECHRRNASGISSLFVYDEYWDRVKGYAPRSLESVVLKPGEKEELVHDIDEFKKGRARYRHLGVPYHRGYLLYGPPGTGKTSLVSALAARFKMSIYLINLTEFNDKSLVSAMKDIPPNSVIVFEDIDCVKTGRARLDGDELGRKQSGNPPGMPDPIEQFGVTLSGLLNALDGFNAPEDVLFVMTTNKVEALDEALLRPGRIDHRLYMGQACEEQKTELYRRFFSSASMSEARAFVEKHRSAVTMAEFQGLLLRLEQSHKTIPLQDEPEGTLPDRPAHSEDFLARKL
jgi:chaperone BCS1